MFPLHDSLDSLQCFSQAKSSRALKILKPLLTHAHIHVHGTKIYHSEPDYSTVLDSHLFQNNVLIPSSHLICYTITGFLKCIAQCVTFPFKSGYMLTCLCLVRLVDIHTNQRFNRASSKRMSVSSVEACSIFNTSMISTTCVHWLYHCFM